MLSHNKIQSIYNDCRGILLLFDDNKQIQIKSLVKEFLTLTGENLEKIAVEAGFNNVPRFLQASKYFEVFKEDGEFFVGLKRKVMKESGNCSQKQNKGDKTAVLVEDGRNKMHDEPEQMEVDISNSNINETKDQNPECDSIICIDDDEKEVAIEPQFIVEISDLPRYDKSLEKEKEVTKNTKALSSKDLRHLINARKIGFSREWKNDMYFKLYPEEKQRQEILLAEKLNGCLLRHHELQK
uniref:CSON005555 protein n=1 Tax=Culicoides sonorensis TaxID=179676 RepID=A0A336LVP2_CULSO